VARSKAGESSEGSADALSSPEPVRRRTGALV